MNTYDYLTRFLGPVLTVLPLLLVHVGACCFCLLDATRLSCAQKVYIDRDDRFIRGLFQRCRAVAALQPVLLGSVAALPILTLLACRFGLGTYKVTGYPWRVLLTVMGVTDVFVLVVFGVFFRLSYLRSKGVVGDLFRELPKWRDQATLDRLLAESPAAARFSRGRAAGGFDRVLLLWLATPIVVVLLFVAVACLPSDGRFIAASSGSTSVAFSPDGTLLASGQEGGAVLIYDVQTGKCVRNLDGDPRFVTCVSFGPRGELLAAGGAQGCIRLWDATTWRPLPMLETHDRKGDDSVPAPGKRSTSRLSQEKRERRDAVNEMAFSQDGRFLASLHLGSDRIRIWGMTDRTELTCLDTEASGGTPDSVFSISFSPTGELLAGGSYHGHVRLWATGTWSERRVAEGHGGAVSAVAFSPSGKLLATSCPGRVMLWDTETWAKAAELKPAECSFREDPADRLTFSPDERYLAFGAPRPGIGLTAHGVFLLDRGRNRWTVLLDSTGGSAALSFSPDGTLLASAGHDGIFLWKIR